MNIKFQKKFRIETARLKNWDYRSESPYFITICTKNRDHFFGEIRNGNMLLNDIGRLAERFWMEIPAHFPNVGLGNFVVMPNHTHGVLIMGPDGLGVDERRRDVALQRLYRVSFFQHPQQQR